MVMGICLNCKNYNSSDLTELGLCKKHNLSMHCLASQECFEEKIDNTDALVEKCKKIMKNRNIIDEHSFKEQAKILARLLMSTKEKLNDDELDFLGDVAYANIIKIVEAAIDDVKCEIKYSNINVTSGKLTKIEKQYQYNIKEGIKTSETEVLTTNKNGGIK